MYWKYILEIWWVREEPFLPTERGSVFGSGSVKNSGAVHGVTYTGILGIPVEILVHNWYWYILYWYILVYTGDTIHTGVLVKWCVLGYWCILV